MQDIFFQDKSQYTQGLSPLKEYAKQLAFYIQTTKGYTEEVAKQKAVEIIRARFKDRPLKCFQRLENGDRVVKTTTLKSYIYDNLKDDNIIVPTLTTYMPRKREKAMTSEFVFTVVTRRGKAKKEAFAAKARNDMLLFDNKNNEQSYLKTYANSMSGAFAQEACILYNPANHSALTSITRTMTSLSNANNERIIAGNRYYPRESDVYNNLVYIASTCDAVKIETAVLIYGLKFPTVEDTIAVLKRSSDLYFHNHQFYATRVTDFLSKLSRGQLAAICYIGDLYHIRQHNPGFVRRMLEDLSTKVTSDTPIESALSDLKQVDENILNFVHHIFYKELFGKGKNYAEMPDQTVPAGILLTSQKITQTLQIYKEFFNSFFMNNVMPNNAFRLKNMRRRTVVLSDTDSTCFTLDEWIKWYGNGVYNVNPQTVAIGGAIAYITTQVIINLLRVLSKNLNIDKELIGKLGMKNEFLWLTHAPANVSKHYFAYTVIQESTVLGEPELEIKGVHLKNSAVPKFVIDDARDIMKGILVKASENQPQRLSDVIKRCVKVENMIKDSVLKGMSTFLKRSKIKSAESYAEDATKSPYARHTFWQEVFSFKYGEFLPPPYDVIKLPTVVTSKTALTAWFNSIEDEAVRSRLMNWFEQTGKKDLPTIYMSEDFVAAYGIPPEIMSVIDVRRVQLDVSLQHRVILETCGVMLYKDKLITEQFSV